MRGQKKTGLLSGSSGRGTRVGGRNLLATALLLVLPVVAQAESLTITTFAGPDQAGSGSTDGR
jgi:hypothetical protein